jgi:hypothetical protein
MCSRGKHLAVTTVFLLTFGCGATISPSGDASSDETNPMGSPSGPAGPRPGSPQGPPNDNRDERPDQGGQNVSSLAELSIGSITLGVPLTGDTGGAGNNLDGLNSGLVGGDEFSWSGPDHVYELEWPGGGIRIELLYNDVDGDLDLILWGGKRATMQIGASSGSLDKEEIVVADPDLPAGTYWIVIDGWRGDSNDYELLVTRSA